MCPKTVYLSMPVHPLTDPSPNVCGLIGPVEPRAYYIHTTHTNVPLSLL